jgi:hypothetical protein
MFWTFVIILIAAWLLGVISSYTFGGLIHLLLVMALIAMIYRIITGRRIT